MAASRSYSRGLAAAQDVEVGDADRGGDVGREELVVGAADDVDADLAHRAAPLVVDEQVAAVAVLDRDRRGRVVEDRLQAVGLDAQVALAGGERLGHRVERGAELADLAEAVGGDAGVELAVGERSAARATRRTGSSTKRRRPSPSAISSSAETTAPPAASTSMRWRSACELVAALRR